MIDQKNTRVFRTEHRPVQTGVIFADEGIAAVFVKEGDLTVVRPSTGAANENFAGLSLSRNCPPTFGQIVLEGVVAANGKIELPRVPITGQLLVKIGGDEKVIVAIAPADADKIQLNVDELTTHANGVGLAYFIQFAYELSVSEARTLKGDAPIGGLSSSAQGVIGLFVEGDVSTSYFDASVDWSAVIHPKLGADGLLTATGSGTTLTNVIVQQAPSAASPSLVVTLR